MNFNGVCANPPYNDSSGRNLYSDFIDLYSENSELCMIVPAKWAKSGSRMQEFRKRALSGSYGLKSVDFLSQEQTFGKQDVFVEFGYTVVHAERGFKGETKVNGRSAPISKFDVLLRDYKLSSIIDKVQNLKTADMLYVGKSGTESGSQSLRHEKFEGSCLCWVSQFRASEFGNRQMWIDKDEADLGSAKVIISESNGDTPGFGSVFPLKENETYTNSYVGFEVDDFQKAQSLASYFKTDFADLMLYQRKANRHVSRSVLKWVPVPELDGTWSTERLRNENPFGFTEDEWQVIESKIRR